MDKPFEKDDLVVISHNTSALAANTFGYIDEALSGNSAYRVSSTNGIHKGVIIHAFVREPTALEAELYNRGHKTTLLPKINSIPDFVVYINNIRSTHYKQFLECVKAFDLPSAFIENRVNQGDSYIGYKDGLVVSYKCFDSIPNRNSTKILNRKPVVKSVLDLLLIKGKDSAPTPMVRTNMIVTEFTSSTKYLVRVKGAQVTLQTLTANIPMDIALFEAQLENNFWAVLEYREEDRDWLRKLPMLEGVCYTHDNGNIFRWGAKSSIVKHCSVYDTDRIYSPARSEMTPSPPKDVRWLEACEEKGRFIRRDTVEAVIEPVRMKSSGSLNTDVLEPPVNDGESLTPEPEIVQKSVSLKLDVKLEILPIKTRK